MPFNGSGVYSPPAADFPAVAGTLILSTKFNNVVNDLATALSDCVTRDGQSAPTANLPMGGFKFINVADGTARASPVANFASLGQVQDSGLMWGGTVGGTADALTITLTPAIPAYVAGQRFIAKSGAGANTGAATIAVSGLATKAIQKNGAALAAGDIRVSLWYEFVYDGAAFQLNPLGWSSVLSGNAINVIDSNLSILGSGDATKILRFDVDANVPTATALTVTPGQGGILPAGIGPLPYAGSTIPAGWLECDGSSQLRATYPALFAAIGTTWGSADGTHFNLPPPGRTVIGNNTATTVETVSVTAAANAVAVASNTDKWITGMPVVVSAASGFAGLVNGSFFIVRVDATHISIATTLLNAQNGTVVTVTGTGAATFTWTGTTRTLGQTGGEETHAMSLNEFLNHTHNTATSNSGGTGGLRDNAGATLSDGATGTVRTGGPIPVGGNAAMNNMSPYIVCKMIISY